MPGPLGFVGGLGAAPVVKTSYGKMPTNLNPGGLFNINLGGAAPGIPSVLNPVPNFNAPANTATAAVTGKAAALATQQTLKRLGYAVSIDGIIGPETKSALAAQKAGIKAAVWNASRIAPSNTGNTGVGPTTGPVAPNNTSTNTPTAQNALMNSILASENKALPGDNSAAILGLQNLLSRGQVNAGALATADANTQYNPVIAGLKQNITQQTAQGTQDQSDIKNWYDTLVANIASRNSDNAAANTSAVNGITSATGGIASALGLSAGSAGGSNIYQTGNIQAAAAAANAASENAYGNDLQSVTAGQGLQARTNQSAIDANKLADLKSQELAQEAARGSAIVSAQGKYQEQNTTNKEQYVKDKLGIQQAADASKQQNFSNVAAIGGQKIAVANSTATALNNAAKVAAGITKANQAYQVQLKNANARLIAANAGRTKAITAGKLANNKITTASSSLFPGLSAKDSVNTLFNIQDKLASDTSLFDNKGRLIKGRTQALAVALRSDLAKAGADPRLNIEAKYQAFNILQALGVTPDRNWFKG